MAEEEKEKEKILEKLKTELEIRNFSLKTIKSYMNCVNTFLDFSG